MGFLIPAEQRLKPSSSLPARTDGKERELARQSSSRFFGNPENASKIGQVRWQLLVKLFELFLELSFSDMRVSLAKKLNDQNHRVPGTPVGDACYVFVRNVLRVPFLRSGVRFEPGIRVYQDDGIS